MRFRRDLVFSWRAALLCASLTICGCAAQAPVAPSVIERPALDNDELAEWRSYYANQFNVYAEHALKPADFYPDVADEAYRLEEQRWVTKQTAAIKRQRRKEVAYARLAVVLMGFAGYGAYILVTGR